MESTTKNRQSPATLRRLIERAFGPDQVPATDDFATELSEGWFNVAYRVALRDGTVVVLKIAPPAEVPVLTREIGMMRSELEAMRLIAEQTTVPIPRVHAVDLTHEIIAADYFFMEFVDAVNFGFADADGLLSAEVVREGNRQLGALNREINGIVGPHFGPLLGPGSPTWREAFLTMFDDTLADGERVGIDLGWTSNQLRDVVARYAGALDEVIEPRLVEVDLWAKNSMIRDGRIVAVLDHERAIWGDPVMEAGLTSVDFTDWGDPTAFQEGFGLEQLTPGQRTRRRLYSLYLAVIMAVETRYRGHTDTAVYDLARRELDGVLVPLGLTR